MEEMVASDDLPSGDKVNMKHRIKQARRKQYEDLQIQNTNTSSIVSKRSVEYLYTSKLSPASGEWYKYFVPNLKRRSPSVNRGYWIRMEAIRRSIFKIVDSERGADQEITIINLGCGFDPLPFELLHYFRESELKPFLRFVDIDYPELIEKKLEIMRNTPEIMDLMGTNLTSHNINDFIFSTNNYCLLGCDLKNTELYRKQITNLLGENPSIKIFIAEVSLAYMKPKPANEVIEFSSRLSYSHFLVLEQIIPDGRFHPFARKMLYHFEHLRSPLQCVEFYPTKMDQLNRFKKYFTNVEILDLFEAWVTLIGDDTKKRVGEIEPFDEWEEFIMFCQHYVVIHSTNAQNTIYQTSLRQKTSLPPENNISVGIENVGNAGSLTLRFPAACTIQNSIIINGGLGQVRTDKTFMLNDNIVECLPIEGSKPSPRMCHTMNSLNDLECVLIGGRSRPDCVLDDVYLFRQNQWQRIAILNRKRCRHAVATLNEEEVLIFGGVSDDVDNDQDKFVVLNCKTGKQRNLCPNIDIPNLFGSSIVYDAKANEGYILGGMVDRLVPTVNSNLYQFTISGNYIVIREIYRHDYFLRISCHIKLLEEKCLLIVGGISPSNSLGQKDTILIFNIETKVFSFVIIDDKIWESYPPMLIGSSVTTLGRDYILLCGGAICYSFGSYYSGVFRISVSNGYLKEGKLE